MLTISESDWKIFRQFHPVAVERFCQQLLEEINLISANDEVSFHQRYLAVFNTVQQKNRDMSYLFDNPRRSSAILQLKAIVNCGLLHEDEVSRFSPELQELLSSF